MILLILWWLGSIYGPQSLLTIESWVFVIMGPMFMARSHFLLIDIPLLSDPNFNRITEVLKEKGPGGWELHFPIWRYMVFETDLNVQDNNVTRIIFVNDASQGMQHLFQMEKHLRLISP